MTQLSEDSLVGIAGVLEEIKTQLIYLREKLDDRLFPADGWYAVFTNPTDWMKIVGWQTDGDGAQLHGIVIDKRGIMESAHEVTDFAGYAYHRDGVPTFPAEP